jgi:hypothetical protein
VIDIHRSILDDFNRSVARAHDNLHNDQFEECIKQECANNLKRFKHALPEFIEKQPKWWKES